MIPASGNAILLLSLLYPVSFLVSFVKSFRVSNVSSVKGNGTATGFYFRL